MTGLPVRYARSLGSMKAMTVLRRGAKPAIEPDDIQAQQTESTLVVIFSFPRITVFL